MIWAGPQSLPRSPGIGWGHGGVQQPQPYFPQPQPRFNPYASQNPKFMPLPGPMPGPMPPPRGPGKGRSGRSYRPPTFPSNYGQMRYTPQRFGGYGIPSSLPGILNPPIGPPPGGPGKGRRPGGPGRKGGGSPGKGGGGSPGQFPPSGPPPTQLPSPPPTQLPSPGPGSPGKRSPGSPGRKGGGGPLIRDEFDPSAVQPFQPQEPVITDQYFPSHQVVTGRGGQTQTPNVQPQPAVNQPYLPNKTHDPLEGMRVNMSQPALSQPGGGGMFGTLGGPGYGEYPLGTAGPRVDPSDPAYRAPPGNSSMDELRDRNLELQQKWQNASPGPPLPVPTQFRDIRPVVQPLPGSQRAQHNVQADVQPVLRTQPALLGFQQNQTNQFQPQQRIIQGSLGNEKVWAEPGSGFGMPPPPAPLAMVGDPVDVGFSSGVTVPQPTMSQAQKRAQYFQQQRMNRAGYSTGGITDLPVDRRQEGGKTGDSGSKTRMSELMDQGFSYDEALNAAILEKQGARPVASGESASSYEQSQADRQRRFNEIQTLAHQEMLRRINQVEGHVPGPQRGFLKTALMKEIQQDYDKYPRGEYVFRRDRTE